MKYQPFTRLVAGSLTCLSLLVPNVGVQQAHAAPTKAEQAVLNYFNQNKSLVIKLTNFINNTTVALKTLAGSTVITNSEVYYSYAIEFESTFVNKGKIVKGKYRNYPLEQLNRVVNLCTNLYKPGKANFSYKVSRICDPFIFFALLYHGNVGYFNHNVLMYKYILLQEVQEPLLNSQQRQLKNWLDQYKYYQDSLLYTEAQKLVPFKILYAADYGFEDQAVDNLNQLLQPYGYTVIKGQ
ncbi:hypothetical protein [Psittacicella hinzii]|uniref:Uncharacterized protein n=1 Tax=Psittacicella hinzii TaxID=2028575 RepID=A0A3A1YDB3_9GAMM|nr:hypothetical protein [Psittacicella hinzii]RIY35160.1 hypothetical protein CKF58_06995 [Psittacicella hinzii]